MQIVESISTTKQQNRTSSDFQSHLVILLVVHNPSYRALPGAAGCQCRQEDSGAVRIESKRALANLTLPPGMGAKL